MILCECFIYENVREYSGWCQFIGKSAIYNNNFVNF